MAYVDLNSIHNPATGTIAPASWGDQVRDNLEFLHKPPRVRASRSTTFSHNSSGGWLNYPITDADTYDPEGMHDPAVNPERITITIPGVYLITGTAVWDSNATGRRAFRILLNGGATEVDSDMGPASGGTPRNKLATQYVFAAGDYAEFEVWQDSGATITVLSAHVEMVWIAP